MKRITVYLCPIVTHTFIDLPVPLIQPPIKARPYLSLDFEKTRQPFQRQST